VLRILRQKLRRHADRLSSALSTLLTERQGHANNERAVRRSTPIGHLRTSAINSLDPDLIVYTAAVVKKCDSLFGKPAALEKQQTGPRTGAAHFASTCQRGDVRPDLTQTSSEIARGTQFALEALPLGR